MAVLLYHLAVSDQLNGEGKLKHHVNAQDAENLFCDRPLMVWNDKSLSACMTVP